ncbi:MAG: thioredoxin-dependent thiol peroxidase [Rhodospirillales bacterium]|nr:MAG: thioredoxin-dependent thiol peroxidase [Rhodospirillales bacterium]
MTVSVGDSIPDFTLPTDGGGTIRSDDLRGNPSVLYFYPKDDTSGCTKEAMAFRDLADPFGTTRARIVGISRDSVASHDKFKAKHDLNFTLASDEDGRVCEAFGVWVEKNMYGKKYMGIERATFLVDGEGVIRHVWRKVKVPGHAAAVLEAAQAL